MARSAESAGVDAAMELIMLDCAMLVALGVRTDGKRDILGVSVALSEAEVHWRQFLTELEDRGLHDTELFISDDHAGLKAVRRAVFPSVPCASARESACQFHLQQNAGHHVPRMGLRAEWAETALPEGLAVFGFQEAHRRRLRTTNVRALHYSAS